MNKDPRPSSENQHLLSNVWKLYMIRFLTWFMVIMPIIVLFYQENGLSFQEIFIVQSFFSFMILALEVPSGYLADNWGRKNTILLGCILLATGYTQYCFASSFSHFLFAEFFLGIAISLISGADSALLYDSLLESKQEHRYQGIEGKLHSLSSFSEGTASLLGGILALVSLRTPFFVEASVVTLAIPFALSLKEPQKVHQHATDNSWTGIWKAVKYSLHENKAVKWLILYAAFIGASTFTVVWFVQPYFQQTGLTLGLFGLAWALLQFSVGIFALLSERYEKLLGRKAALASLMFFPLIAYLLISSSNKIWALGFLLPFYMVRGIKEPIFKDTLNKLISSDKRATILSIRSMLMRISFVIIGPFIGWISDTYTLQTAFLSAGIIFATLSLLSLLGLRKHHAI